MVEVSNQMQIKIWNKYNYWLLAILCVFVAGIIVQTNMMLNFDVSWLMKVSNKLLSGGHYYTDFIETNPPLILYLYMPAVLLAKIFHLSFTIAFRTYTFIIAAGSIYLCNVLMRHIFDDTSNHIRYVLLVTIGFIFILMPGFAFGEREHFVLILTMPYLFLLDLRLSNKNINIYLIFLIGVMAGLGFAIKPYFLFALIACELYFMYKKRNLFACIRFETICIGVVILLYLISIFVFTPNYIYKILPLLYLYLVVTRAAFELVISQITIVFWLIVLMAYFLFYRRLHYRSLAGIFIFASFGYLIAYLAQHTIWYYHLLPMLAMATMLMVLIVCEKLFAMIAKYKSGIKLLDVILLVSLSILIIIGPIINTVKHTVSGITTSKQLRADELFQYMKRNAYGKLIYIFDERILIASGLVDYAHAISASRSPSQLFLPGLIWLSNKPNLTDTQKNRLMKYKKEIINIVVEDLQKNKPKFILINQTKHSLPPNRKFSYIKFFSQDKRFRKIFKNYTIIMLGDLVVYKRNK